MTKPDWSKAPEGATHYGEQNGDWCAAWYKLHGSRIAVMLADGRDTKWYWRDIDDQDESELIPRLVARPTQWRGPEDGLPPVGASVECHRYAAPCVVMYASEQLVVLRSEFGQERSFKPEDVHPIKTQEQRELDQLQADINEAFEANATLSEFLHAKGYRKP